jgi:uncharacterized membrane protein YbhN (UPF0104 family)
MKEATWQLRLWVAAKWVVMAAILVAAGRVFATALTNLRQHEISWDLGWLIISGVLYILGVNLSAWYWWWAMRSLGQRPGPLAAMRAYYAGHLGKYVPGKALVIIMRTALVRGPNVRVSVAALAVVYETLTCMAAGALLAVVLLLLPIGGQERHLGHALLLLLIAGLPILPWVFNPVARRVAAPFQRADAVPLPHFRTTTLLIGLLLSIGGWFLLGASTWAAVRAVYPYPLGLGELLTSTVNICIATVVGFLALLPGGLGARELVLKELFERDLGAGPAAVAALVLRMTWIVSEVVAVGVLYPLPLLCSEKRTGNTATEADELRAYQEPAGP